MFTINLSVVLIMGCVFIIKLKFVIVKAVQMITRFDVFNILPAKSLVQLLVGVWLRETSYM